MIGRQDHWQEDLFVAGPLPLRAFMEIEKET